MKYVINLFPEKELNIADKIIYFSFNYLRYILVITQFVAICVFFYRFKVDQEIVDLKDTLTQKKAIVEATQMLLKEVERVDKRMKDIRAILKLQEDTKALYSYTFSKIPQNVSISNFSFKQGSAEISGTTLDVNIVKSLYESLRDEKRFKKVRLSSVNKSLNGYDFSLSLDEFQ